MRYLITLTRTTDEFASVVIEADTPEEAQALALDADLSWEAVGGTEPEVMDWEDWDEDED